MRRGSMAEVPENFESEIADERIAEASVPTAEFGSQRPRQLVGAGDRKTELSHTDIARAVGGFRSSDHGMYPSALSSRIC